MDLANLENMARELKCPICLSLLKSAVSLTCNHVFCNFCIVKSMRSMPYCPICKVPTRPREIRAAPHMDNLVSICKSMEVAAGANIFSTQLAPPAINTVGADQEKEKHNTDQEIIGQRKRKCRKRATSEQSSSNPEEKGSENLNHHAATKPSFSTNKRIHVTPYPVTETPLRPSKVSELGDKHILLARDRQEDPNSESTEDRLTNTNKTISDDDHRGPFLSPFFWLNEADEEEHAEKSSFQQMTESVPSQCAPCFSDLKGSDDETVIRSTPTKLNAAKVFESEMFEWTQRACSPELSSTPKKKQTRDKLTFSTVQDDKFKEGANLVLQMSQVFSGKTIVSKSYSRKDISQKKKGRNTRAVGEKENSSGDAIENVLLLDDSKEPYNSGEIVENSSQENEEAEKKRSTMLGKKSATRLKSLKKDEQEGCHKTFTDNVGLATVAEASGDSPAAYANEGDQHLDRDVDTGVSNKFKSWMKMSNSRLQRKNMTRSPDNVLANMLEVLVNPLGELQVQSNSDDKGSGSMFTACREGVHKSCLREGKQILTSLVSELDQTKNAVGRPATEPATENVVACKGKQNNAGDCSNLQAVSTLTSSSKNITQNFEGSELRKCTTSTSHIQCAFCQSSDDTKDSGIMMHYFKGKPVAAEFNGGINVIHCHKYCAEWAPNVYFEGNSAINLSSELARSRKIKCSCCGIKGAALGCYQTSCRKSFHLTCAKVMPECRWDTENFVMLCPLHATVTLPFEDSKVQRQSKTTSTPKRPISDKASLTNCHDPSQTWSWPSGSSCKWLVCCSALSVGEKELVHKFAKLTGVSISKVWTPEVTHIIASTDENGIYKRTLKTLKGILTGKWILKVDWIKSCMEFNKPVDEDKFELSVDVHGITDGPKRGRMRAMNKLPKLFNGFRFYFSGDYTVSYIGYLQDLVITAGGTVLHRKPISRDKERLLDDCITFQTFIVYSVEPPLNHKDSYDIVLKNRKAEAKALANACEATVISNALIIDAIAGCDETCMRLCHSAQGSDSKSKIVCLPVPTIVHVYSRKFPSEACKVLQNLS